ncbi:putative DNA-binding protein [Streptomyces scabiei 87.22]|uniref:Putative DNA-binding protein n=1 Tax=Streptomyces scabiei (strain 87.22) TaxID=680198 RepID=C9Z967_STRSW|nr:MULTISPECIES: helix-turn-helix transcriptional regulator [Streptomyces]MDX2652095.1 helix-turn-helix transcriptional regulator [Streptomyces scabiei]MDX2749669.1 helix-turn-helix transcriptional regulator [Streptomyces scabiei]MDX2863998.1 helix-turn-helix transcriptional regulator [Streptomyces scabiei]MDX2897365.1 helix-turn-helix transcriptional regulator [Streptomyces scabiei]MDX2905857.1 helix-turn-helix transcriptional regulator [Streptomyces scabiei]
MAAPHRPTARRIELGHQLRQLRKEAGLTIVDAATRLRISDTQLQRVETGLQSFRRAEQLKKLLAVYRVTDDDRVEELLAIQREASSQEWWTNHTGNLSSGMPKFLGIEAAAEEIRAYHPNLVYGLLQTEAYARSIHENVRPITEITSEFLEHNVTIRMRRKEALLRDHNPLRLWVILYEPALRYIVGDENVMREQYSEITALAALDHITIQILPQTVRGYLGAHDFAIMDLGDAMPATVQVDTAGFGAAVTDKPREVSQFRRQMEALSRSALPAEDTPKFLSTLSREITHD